MRWVQVCSTSVSVRLGLQWPGFCRIVHIPFRAFRVVHNEWPRSRHAPDCEKYVERVERMLITMFSSVHLLAGNVRHHVSIAHPTPRVM
jgi:hypothetical protein